MSGERRQKIPLGKGTGHSAKVVAPAVREVGLPPGLEAPQDGVMGYVLPVAAMQVPMAVRADGVYAALGQVAMTLRFMERR